MKLFVATKIRNEIDIIRLFISHLDALFDKVYLLDHRSKDGTTEILQQAAGQREGWEYIFLDFNGHFHKQVSNIIIKKAFSEGADFLFFLDADEFIHVTGRADLEARLAVLSDPDTVGKFFYQNAIPVDCSEGTFTSDRKLWYSGNKKSVQKIVIPRVVYEHNNQSVTVTQGNHLALNGEQAILNADYVGDFVHIPIRSQSQIEKKYLIKTIAYLAIQNRNPQEGIHNFSISKNIAENFRIKGPVEIQDNVLIHVTESELRDRGHDVVTLDSLMIPFSSSLQLKTAGEETSLGVLVADALSNFEYENLDKNHLVVRDGVMTISRRSDKSKKSVHDDQGSIKKWIRQVVSDQPLKAIADYKIRVLIKESGLFDENWYRENYLNTRDNNVDAIDHYLENGSRELSNPGPAFDARRYINENPDVRENGINPLVHYLKFGRREKRKIYPVERTEKEE